MIHRSLPKYQKHSFIQVLRICLFTLRLQWRGKIWYWNTIVSLMSYITWHFQGQDVFTLPFISLMVLCWNSCTHRNFWEWTHSVLSQYAVMLCFNNVWRSTAGHLKTKLRGACGCFSLKRKKMSTLEKLNVPFCNCYIVFFPPFMLYFQCLSMSVNSLASWLCQKCLVRKF